MYCIITVEEIFVLAITVFDSNNHAEDKTKGRVIVLFYFSNPRVKRLTKAFVIALLFTFIPPGFHSGIDNGV